MPTNIVKRPSRSDRQAHLLHIYHRLLKHFGPRHWWPANHAWEMMVGAILTQNTAWTNVDKALRCLKAAKALTVSRIASLPRRTLERLIRSSGFFRQKAKRLQTFARYLRDNPEFYRQLRGASPPSPLPLGEGESPRRLGEASFLRLREKLLAMNGIGPETADSMLLYAGAYPVFVVDAYTRRIGQRLGLFQFNDYARVQSYFERALPQNAALYNEYHALLVHLAKDYCKKRDPRCGACPVSRECAFGQKRMNSHARKN